MSTRRKEDVSYVTEKRGISPSHLKSPKPYKPVSISRSLGSSPSSQKATPNYLKPTLSSLLSCGDAIKENILARRRSFDKPPSPTPTTKPRGFSPTRSLRSSSFSGKTGRAVSSPKSDRSLKGTREASKQHLYARAVGGLKKSASFASKSASRKKDPSDHIETNIAGDEEDQVVGNLELEDESHNKADSPTASEVLDADGGDASEVETSPMTLEQRDASNGEAESPTICEESDDNVPTIESPTLLGQDDADPLSEVDDSTTNPDHSKPDEDEGEEAKELDVKLEGEAGEVQKGVGEDGGEAAPRLSHGKKDVGLSNNVIEEMTREQRRNKVRALAGAFETVISLQEHK
ncbi:uncharacterized protein LOC125212694 [Salvia hispanica]|uniref:uncharacterized protein LOC125212694 n=1 Tax=Salvia hispanica TaxID=49212 RepID=UPI0020091F3D|nr:uncharacterized protein LOC125212694 [Salvia hispanica]